MHLPLCLQNSSEASLDSPILGCPASPRGLGVKHLWIMLLRILDVAKNKSTSDDDHEIQSPEALGLWTTTKVLRKSHVSQPADYNPLDHYPPTYLKPQKNFTT